MGSSNAATFTPPRCAGPGCTKRGYKGSSRYPSYGYYCSDECIEAHRPIVMAEIAEHNKREDRVRRLAASRLPFVLVRPGDLGAVLSGRPHSNPLY